MSATYKAWLKEENLLDWRGGMPPKHANTIPVLITILDEPANAPASSSTRRCVDCLSRLAANPASLAAIQDPVKWQQVQRRERGLPGREG